MYEINITIKVQHINLIKQGRYTNVSTRQAILTIYSSTWKTYSTITQKYYQFNKKVLSPTTNSIDSPKSKPFRNWSNRNGQSLVTFIDQNVIIKQEQMDRIRSNTSVWHLSFITLQMHGKNIKPTTYKINLILWLKMNNVDYSA